MYLLCTERFPTGAKPSFSLSGCAIPSYNTLSRPSLIRNGHLAVSIPGYVHRLVSDYKQSKSTSGRVGSACRMMTLKYVY